MHEEDKAKNILAMLSNVYAPTEVYVIALEFPSNNGEFVIAGPKLHSTNSQI